MTKVGAERGNIWADGKSERDRNVINIKWQTVYWKKNECTMLMHDDIDILINLQTERG